MVDGHFPHYENGEQTKGKRAIGSICLPDSVKWEVEHKKVKSLNDSTIRGRSTRISFPPNLSGIDSVQVTFIHRNGNGKMISSSFQDVVDRAKNIVNKPHYDDNKLD